MLFDVLNLPGTAVNINSQSFTSSSLFVIGRINWMQSYGLMAVITLVSPTLEAVSFSKCEFVQNLIKVTQRADFVHWQPLKAHLVLLLFCFLPNNLMKALRKGVEK